ncbi:MlaD family protein [Acidovorax sp. SUPP3334]|uniref:MlaD family protein n=1 Tax=Acidovorax sp. SUPP3334 TaxID=2920881 RepID=UPI0023DE67BF|nr:MlaD family protein [Acidovorax sp. SUPP3334]GKT22410.1 MlaD family protein [Acidovorax sp. SUPP3334]
MENKSHALAAGIFVVVVAALLAGLGLWLTRDNTSYQLYELSSKQSVGGLQPQAAVRYKGVAVGKVVRIGFDPDVAGNVLIRIAVSDQAPITPATFAVLGYQGVTGLAHVLLDDGQQPEPPMPKGPSGLPRLPLKTSPFGQLAEQGPAILSQVEEATSRINDLLSDDNQKRIANAIDNLAQAAGNASALMKRLDTTVVQRLDPALAAVPGVASDARQTLQALREAGNSASAAANEVGTAVKQLSAEGGPIDQIAEGSKSLATAADRFGRVTLPRLNHAADETSRAVRRLGRTASTISDNPQSLIYGSGTAAGGPGEPGFEAPVLVKP